MVGIELRAVHQHSVGRFVQLRDVTWKPRTAVVSVCTSEVTSVIVRVAVTLTIRTVALILDE